MKEITIKKNEFAIFDEICDCASRLYSGQFEILQSFYSLVDIFECDDKIASLLLAIIKYKFDGLNLNSRHSILNPLIKEEARCLYDISHKLRNGYYHDLDNPCPFYVRPFKQIGTINLGNEKINAKESITYYFSDEAWLIIKQAVILIDDFLSFDVEKIAEFLVSKAIKNSNKDDFIPFLKELKKCVRKEKDNSVFLSFKSKLLS